MVFFAIVVLVCLIEVAVYFSLFSRCLELTLIFALLIALLDVNLMCFARC